MQDLCTRVSPGCCRDCFSSPVCSRRPEISLWFAFALDSGLCPRGGAVSSPSGRCLPGQRSEVRAAGPITAASGRKEGAGVGCAGTESLPDRQAPQGARRYPVSGLRECRAAGRREGARRQARRGGPMASPGGGSPGLLLWLLLLQPWLGGAQSGSASPPLSSAPTSQSSSGGGHEVPGASVWKAEGQSATPGPQEAAASPQVVAVTPGASGSYRAVTTAKQLFPAGDVSGPRRTGRGRGGQGGRDPALGRWLFLGKWGWESEWPQPCA